MVSVTFVPMLSGVRFAPPSCAESAIEKHAACAAAINSSGFVPGPFSNRDVNEYCVSFSTPPGAEIVPFPACQVQLPLVENSPHSINTEQLTAASYAVRSSRTPRDG